MARRSDHSYRELRELILDAAYELVREEGVDNLSARNIAAKIGYSVGTLYNIFASMDDVILYLNSRVLDLFIAELEGKLSQSHLPVMDNLLMIARCYVDFSEKNYNLWHLLFINKVSAGEDQPKWYHEKINGLHKLVVHQISLLNRHNMDVEMETCIYWSGIHGVASLNKSGKLHYASPQSVDMILSTIVKRIFVVA